MTVEKVTFSVKTDRAFEACKNYLADILKTKGLSGKGLMTFEGLYSDDKDVFLGVNKKLESKILTFNGETGQKRLDSFRSDFLDLTANDYLRDELSISSLNAIYVLNKPDSVAVATDLQETFEKTIQIQQKSIPKMLIDKGALYIGGKTGASSLKIDGSVTADLQVQYLVLNLKLKDAAASNFFSLLRDSIQVDCPTVVAFTISNQVSKTTQSQLLKFIQTSVVKDFSVGKVVNFGNMKQKSTTKSGKYVLRALSGLLNKLKDTKTGAETQVIITEWLEQFMVKHQDDVTNFAAWNKTLITILGVDVKP